MKKYIAIASSVALLAANILPAVAANTCVNGTTGPFSDNYCTISNSSNVKVNNVNDAQIRNNVSTEANTGGNSASYNTLGGSVSTGDAVLSTGVFNVANVNTTTISGGPAASGNSGVNEITGPESDNRIEINNARKVDVYNSNTATVNNRVNTRANTGDNVADYNTGPAVVDTGNATLMTTVQNHVNDSATAVSAGAGGTGGNSAGNSTTGPFSVDYVRINNSSSASVKNVNDLIVHNFVNALSNTGFNSASYNTLGGDILSGDAFGSVGLDTEGNINTTTIEMAMGGALNDAGNGITGPFSDNRIELLNNQNIVVDNWNNKCKSHNASRLGYPCNPSDLGVFNYNHDVVNTGESDSDYNTGGGSVASGLADLIKTVQTHLNDTLTVIMQ